jgi:hypothetical protein
MALNQLAPEVVNAMYQAAPTSGGLKINSLGENSMANPYVKTLLARAIKEYPFIATHNPIVTVGSGEGFAETWPAGETGAPDKAGNPTRPKMFPMDKTGIEVYKPNNFTFHDLAGELLHIDPRAAKVRDYLLKTYRPDQWDKLKRHALDYDESIKRGMKEDWAKQNAIDSAIRGYVVRQWPEEIDRDLSYSEDQKEMLEALKKYIKTGK